MSGIYPQGAVPSYRSSSQTVVVHHWSPAYSKEERDNDLAAGYTVGYETVVPYNFECSVPVSVTVRESDGTSFWVEDIPTQCPLCERKFSGFDAKRIRNAAIAQHLRLCDWRNDQIVHPTDLILDV